MIKKNLSNIHILSFDLLIYILGFQREREREKERERELADTEEHAQ